MQVPLFDQMDDLVLNNICERLKPLLFIKGEKVGLLNNLLCSCRTHCCPLSFDNLSSPPDFQVCILSLEFNQRIFCVHRF